MFQTSTAFFKIAGLKSFKTFCRDQPSSFFHRFLNSKFSNRFNFTWTFFEKTYIIQFSNAFLQQIFEQFFQINFYVLAEEIMAAKIAEAINLFTISDSKISVGNNQLFLCRPSYLTIYVCSPNHYDDLKVQLHELTILIRCTL